MRACNYRTRLRHEPERGVIYSVLLAHLETLVARSREHGRGLPRFVERELCRYLQCGILAFGFARVHCSGCGRDELPRAHQHTYHAVFRIVHHDVDEQTDGSHRRSAEHPRRSVVPRGA